MSAGFESPVVAAPGSLPAAASAYDLGYQISPIILQGGVVSNAPGGVGLLTPYLPPPADDGTPFARFIVDPGGTLIDQSIATYPFANQQVAANATIQQPLRVSMRMIAPVNSAGGYLTKRSAFTALQQILSLHNVQGGTYIVATPAYIYGSMILTTMTDITDEENPQKQIQWQMDFFQPLTLAGAAAAQNNLIQKLTNGSSFTGDPGWSGLPEGSPATFTNVAAALAVFGGAGDLSVGGQ